MLLTTKSRYAIMALTDLASNTSDSKPIALYEIANRQDITIKYLEQIFVKLRKTGIVISSKGPGGGYILAKDPSEFKLIEVIIAVEEDIRMTRCSMTKIGCMTKGVKCVTHDLWKGLENIVENYFGSITLADLCRSTKQQQEFIKC